MANDLLSRFIGLHLMYYKHPYLCEIAIDPMKRFSSHRHIVAFNLASDLATLPTKKPAEGTSLVTNKQNISF